VWDAGGEGWKDRGYLALSASPALCMYDGSYAAAFWSAFLHILTTPPYFFFFPYFSFLTDSFPALGWEVSEYVFILRNSFSLVLDHAPLYSSFLSGERRTI